MEILHSKSYLFGVYLSRLVTQSQNIRDWKGKFFLIFMWNLLCWSLVLSLDVTAKSLAPSLCHSPFTYLLILMRSPLRLLQAKETQLQGPFGDFFTLLIFQEWIVSCPCLSEVSSDFCRRSTSQDGRWILCILRCSQAHLVSTPVTHLEVKLRLLEVLSCPSVNSSRKSF